jgi:hypothetical protein
MDVQTDAVHGTYEELVDAAEDLSSILDAADEGEFDLTPVMQVWLVDLLERFEAAIAWHLDSVDGVKEKAVSPAGSRSG